MPLCFLCEERLDPLDAASEPRQRLCANCLSHLPWRPPGCLRCGATLPAPQSHCGQCLKYPVIRDHTFSALNYEFPINAMLRGFKFHDAMHWLKPLTQAMLTQLNQYGFLRQPPIEALVPVPLHKKRLQQRGFNQCFWLGSLLAEALDVPLQASWCTRLSSQTPQTALSAIERRKNVRNVFKVHENLINKLPKHIVLLDDVITTGSTAEALAQSFKALGVSLVSVWTLASAQ